MHETQVHETHRYMHKRAYLLAAWVVSQPLTETHWANGPMDRRATTT